MPSHSRDRLWEVFDMTQEDWDALDPGTQFGYQLSIAGWVKNPDGSETAIRSSDIYPELHKDKDSEE
jgi:hypothetical protein